ncbi:hypothetical protein GALMADRAFT_59583 [Galerina marginata CBS 339.88]|uniref:DAGKc domain-containing protein n=1 Tax=Galerina marginata (strain CBS 339.88) TaxID=685588 RepID=A0A067TG78_GALM3|nr:hypothetical protein GALMADRAFT_59583 [Galerina marginata CBS 339.88]
MLVSIINPVCGHSDAAQFFAAHVLPLLTPPDLLVVHTTAKGHAETVLRDLPDPLTVVLCSGDGTLQEIITALAPRPVTFVLVPCGTANALYASLFPPTKDHDPVDYKLKSLHAFIRKSTPVHLSLASTALFSPAGSVQAALSSVVVSTSLHASILHHSEALRQSHPGIERFKIAAQQNSSKWYNGRVNLVPPPSLGHVQVYDPKSNTFVPHTQSTHLDGPFIYFLSTVNVDRLEPEFRISPLARAIPPPPSTCDIVILRPLRDPSTPEDTPQSRLSFVEKTWKVLGAAYQDGAHVRLTYNQDGQILPDGDGPPVIEYFRCAGWEWFPDDQDQDAHLVCADGAILHIPEHGHAVCSVDPFPHGFSVHGSDK